MKLSQLTALGTGDLMPALLYGFEFPDAAEAPPEHSSSPPEEPPDWLITTSVQAGGYSMSYYTVVGAVFRIADNTSHALQDPTPFIRLFHLMAEDSDIRAIERDFPQQRELCGTWGAAYNSNQLGRLDRWLRRFFSLPSPRDGLEAFVRLGMPTEHQMLGWTHLHVLNPPQTLEGLGVQAALTTRDAFGPPDDDFLQAMGSRIGGRAPELYLVWENSD